MVDDELFLRVDPDPGDLSWFRQFSVDPALGSLDDVDSRGWDLIEEMDDSIGLDHDPPASSSR